MAAPNERLRRAREGTPSRRHPGECLSRQELAELVNDHVWAHAGVRVDVDDAYLGKLERGVITWPGERYRSALRAILGANDDSQLGFRNSRRASVRLAVELPVKVDERHVAEVYAAADVFVRGHHQHGGWFMRDAALAQMRWAEGLLRAQCRESVRAKLTSAVARLAHACAFMAFDTCEHTIADGLFDLALHCVRENGDWRFRAYVLQSMARQAVWLGRHDQAHTLVQKALERKENLLPAERANLYAALAVPLAGMNRVAEARRAIGAADTAFAAAREPRTRWERFYTVAQHCSDTGAALVLLAERGHPGADARERLAAAHARRAPEYRRSRVLALTKLASLAARSDREEGLALATSATAEAGEIRSGRIAKELADLRTALSRG